MVNAGKQIRVKQITVKHITEKQIRVEEVIGIIMPLVVNAGKSGYDDLFFSFFFLIEPPVFGAES